jgi:hypothetical protein
VLEFQKLRFEPRVLVDYLSPHSARVTDIRGVLLHAGLKQLQDSGHYEQYLAHLPPALHQQVVHALASSWVPVDLYAAHLEAIDALTDAQIVKLSEPVGAGLLHSLFASFVRAARNNGADGVWFGVRQADRVFARIHQGGACKVTQVGPKDVVIDVSGLNFAHTRCFRIAHCAFLRGAFSFSTKAVVCKPQHEPRRDRLAVHVSWV